MLCSTRAKAPTWDTSAPFSGGSRIALWAFHIRALSQLLSRRGQDQNPLQIFQVYPKCWKRNNNFLLLSFCCVFFDQPLPEDKHLHFTSQMIILWSLRTAACIESSSYSSKGPSDGWAKRNNWPQTSVNPPLPGCRTETQQKAEQRQWDFHLKDSKIILWLISGHTIHLWRSIKICWGV